MEYSSDEFEMRFTYTGTDLGAVWGPQSTRFRLWAPVAEAVSVLLYSDSRDGAPFRVLPMISGEQGTWTAEAAGDLNGVYYTYRVTLAGKPTEACDPYARAVGVNGQRAMVIDLRSTDPEGWEYDRDPHFGTSPTDAVICELHIRDLSMAHGAKFENKGKYLALTEEGRTTSGGAEIGIDHIARLGITHIQLLPVFDFGFTDESRKHPQYNWGYDPVNFNVPEGSYASDAFNGAVRIREFKQMVRFLHQKGLSVVMDVVYNHVFDPHGFCFNRIVPGYFSRIDGNGIYSNGSCCGNDTASERSMVRKYIVDSLCYWAEEYHIDGFRFDLVGLIDIPTIREAMAAVRRIHPNALFYGEGWSLNTRPTRPNVELAVQNNSHKLPDFGFFSDTVRDLLRGSVFLSRSLGFLTGACPAKKDLDACFMGMPHWASQPRQSVNYVSCHDNHTLFDRLSLGAPEAPREVLLRMNRLAAAFTILSQGVPFFMAGEEMLRTKPGKKGGFDSNSYRSPDKVNAIKWSTLDKPEVQEMAIFYRGLIAFRKEHPVLRLGTREAVSEAVRPLYHDNPHTAAYLIQDRTCEIFALFNADSAPVSMGLPEGEWEVNIRDNQAGTQVLDRVSGSVTAAPVSALVLSRKRTVDVVAALLWEKDKLLICQRPPNKLRGLLWEFVGGKVEPGESRREALARECMEELGVRVNVGNEFMGVSHDYPDMRIRLTLFHCTLSRGFPQALEHKALRWVHPGDLDGINFCPADAAIVREVKNVYGNIAPL